MGKEIGRKEREALELLTGRPLAPGDFTGRIWAESLGEGLEIEVTINVRRRAPGEEIRRYRGAVLAYLSENPYSVGHCGCQVAPRRGSYTKYKSDCEGRVVAAVVYRLGSVWRDGHDVAAGPDDVRFLFICGRHRASHGTEPRTMLATIELTDGELAPIRKALAKRKAEHEAKWRREEAEREAERRAKVAADPAHVHAPRSNAPNDTKCWDCGADLPPPAPKGLKLVP